MSCLSNCPKVKHLHLICRNLIRTQNTQPFQYLFYPLYPPIANCHRYPTKLFSWRWNFIRSSSSSASKRRLQIYAVHKQFIMKAHSCAVRVLVHNQVGWVGEKDQTTTTSHLKTGQMCNYYQDNGTLGHQRHQSKVLSTWSSQNKLAEWVVGNGLWRWAEGSQRHN